LQGKSRAQRLVSGGTMTTLEREDDRLAFHEDPRIAKLFEGKRETLLQKINKSKVLLGLMNSSSINLQKFDKQSTDNYL